MILVNFSYLLTADLIIQLSELLGEPISQVIPVTQKFDEQQPFGPQLAALLETIDLTAQQWQSEPIMVALPSLNFIAAVLLAELHGRMGYFPLVVRTRPAPGSAPRRYEVAELLDLQSIREAARRQR